MRHHVLAAIVLASAVALPRPASAEVSVNAGGREIYFQSAPGQTWTRFRNGVASNEILNPFGDARGDGMPSIEQNPFTGVQEVAWGRAGLRPSVMFASWDDVAGIWFERVIARLGSSSPWSGRVVQLTHDDTGDRFILFEDSDAHTILLASAPRDSHVVNRPIEITQPGAPGTSPAMVWDGRLLIMAYGIVGTNGGLEIVVLAPDRDAEGRIPNGGEGVPGIPDPVFQYISTSPHYSHGMHGPAHFPDIPRGGGIDGTLDLDDTVPPLVRVETIGDNDILVTWILGDSLAYVRRVAGNWVGPGFYPLPDPVEHEAARDAVRQLITRHGNSGHGGRGNGHGSP